MNQNFLIIVFSLFFISTSAQNNIVLKDSKSYKATPVWDFICENYALTGIAKVQIAKTEKGGILKLAIETTNSKYTIAGNVYLFMQNNTVLNCIDKGLREINGNQIVSYYNFSLNEMNQLKKIGIHSIHFNIKGVSNAYSSQLGNFTAINKKSFFSTAFDKSDKSYDTVFEINTLYN